MRNFLSKYFNKKNEVQLQSDGLTGPELETFYLLIIQIFSFKIGNFPKFSPIKSLINPM